MVEYLAQNPWWWMGLAVVLAIAEIVSPGVFLIWIAAAAAIAGGIALLGGTGLALQFLIFALLCVACVWAGRRWYADNPVESQDPLLNDRVARMIGDVVIVDQPISHGRGRVRVGDSIWDCSGVDTDAGGAVRIIGANGSILLVEPA